MGKENTPPPPGLTCAGCSAVLPQAGVVHSGWCRHEGKNYCLSCQEKMKIGLYKPKKK